MSFSKRGEVITKKVDGVNYKFYYYTTSYGLKTALKLGSTLIGPLLSVLMQRETDEKGKTKSDIDIEGLVNSFLDKLNPDEKVEMMQEIIERFVKTETTASIDFDDYFRGNYIHAFKVLHQSLEVNFDFLELITRQGRKFMKQTGPTPSPGTGLTQGSNA